MKLITEGAEHHFLTFLERLKVNSSGWIACTFSFSKWINHEHLMMRRPHIREDIAYYRQQARAFVEDLRARGGDLPNAVLYMFSDLDVVLLCCSHDDAEHRRIQKLLESVSDTLPRGFCHYGFLTKDLYQFQKVADHKLLTEKKMAAYEALAQDHMIDSLSLRRDRRDAPVVLVTEDDRFTASYVSQFLKDYDVVVARNGEEAILKYIEYAPDAAFVDVHLPGIDGHGVLQAIKAIDPEAFVVMLSVDTMVGNILSASQSGAVSYLKKPFSRERVLNTLRLSPFVRKSRGLLPIEREQVGSS